MTGGRAGARGPAGSGLALALVLALVGCVDARAGDGRGGGQGDEIEGVVTVLAAASLADAFEAVAVAFEGDHPGTDVVLGLAGSSALAEQVVAGAPADVVATASKETMAHIAAAGRLSSGPVSFARNTLALAVPVGNPAGVRGLPDLADPDLTIALCAPDVPCGAAAQRLLRWAGIEARPDTLERDVGSALAKVRLGEVDAALVYRTDVLAAQGEVESVPITLRPEAGTDYLVAGLADAPNPSAATAFVAFVQDSAAQDILTARGFGPRGPVPTNPDAGTAAPEGAA